MKKKIRTLVLIHWHAYIWPIVVILFIYFIYAFDDISVNFSIIINLRSVHGRTWKRRRLRLGWIIERVNLKLSKFDLISTCLAVISFSIFLPFNKTLLFHSKDMDPG